MNRPLLAALCLALLIGVGCKSGTTTADDVGDSDETTAETGDDDSDDGTDLPSDDSDDADDAEETGEDATDDTPSDVPPFDGGLVAQVDACDDVVVSETAGRLGPWRVDGAILLFPTVDHEGAVRFRAPSPGRPSTLTLVSEADGARFSVEVAPKTTGPELAQDMAPDCAPFPHGVTSGDPTPTSVLLWTRVEGLGDTPEVRWELSTTPTFAELVADGSETTSADRDFTVVVEATGLEPATTYYYRFFADGVDSRVGRTRTAPIGANEHVRLSLISCSSVWSGWFNAYRRLAERDDIDLIVHVGDYIYDFIDDEERIRVPDPELPVPQTLEEHRALHAYYHNDPDLRDARAAHPWVVLWDNHDVRYREPPDFGGGVQAFREWVPTRVTDASRPAVAWRTFRYGDLVDLFVLDALLWRGVDNVPGTDAPSIVGGEQYDWLTSELTSSTAAWRLIASQKLVTPFEAPFEIGGSTWSGFPESRNQLLDFIDGEDLRDIVFLTGDAHLTFITDVIRDQASYDPETHAGSVAVEFLAGSISRGNVDESFPAPPDFLEAIRNTFLGLNPQFAHTDLINHGYGIVDITPERLVVEMWFSPILEASDDETFDVGVQVRRGQRHWDRELLTEPTR